MADTYGFGGSEPTTTVPGGESGQSVNTGTGQKAPYGLEATYRDTMQNDVQRGQSSVDGQGLTPTWDEYGVYPLQTVTTSSDGNTSTIGSWPVAAYYPHKDGDAAAKILPSPAVASRVKNDER